MAQTGGRAGYSAEQYRDSYKDSYARYEPGRSTNRGTIGAVGVELDVSRGVSDSLDLSTTAVVGGVQADGPGGKGKGSTAHSLRPQLLPSQASQAVKPALGQFGFGARAAALSV